MVGEADQAVASILYSTLNPVTGVTVGKVNAVPQVFVGTVIVGAAGNITTLTVLDRQVLAVAAGVVPQAAVKTYRACTV